MSVGGVGGGGGGGGGGAGGAGGASGPSSSGGPSSAGKSGGDSGGPSKSGGAGGDKGGVSKAGESTSAKSTGDVGKTGDTGKVGEAGKVDAQEQAKEAERQRAQSEIQADKFQRSGAPTTSSDVVQNMMKSQGISPTGATTPASSTNPSDPAAGSAPPPAAGAGSTTSDPALAQTTANVEQSKDIAKTETKDSTVKETAKSVIGNALDAVGSAYQALANGVDKAASRALASTVVKTVGDAIGGAVKTVTDKVGGLLDKSATKAAAAWGTTKQLANFGASAALRGIGGIISTGADIVQNGVPQSWREAGALAVKNTISGAAAAGLGFVGGLVAGPPGAIGGAVAGGYLADGFAGRVADGIFGTNRYTSPEAAPAPAAAPQFVDESYIAA